MIYAEHDPAEIEKFKKAGHRVKKAEKSIDAGIAEVRRRLEPNGNIEIGDPGPLIADLAWGTEGGKPVKGVGLLVSDQCQHDPGVPRLQGGPRQEECHR